MICYFCQQPVSRRELNLHHVIPRSEGGEVIAPTHRHCHVTHHSQRGDFRMWGRKGGLTTAARGWWIFNLRRGMKPADPLRWIPFGYG